MKSRPTAYVAQGLQRQHEVPGRGAGQAGARGDVGQVTLIARGPGTRSTYTIDYPSKNRHRTALAHLARAVDTLDLD